MRLILDYETRSEADLEDVGAHEYARHPSTQIMCVAWRLGEKTRLRSVPVQAWSPAVPSRYGELVRALCDPTVKLVAHNAFFEQVITRFVLSRYIHRPEIKEIPPERWLCTMAQACAHTLPRKLEDAGRVMGLPVVKDDEGHKLMLKMSKPRKPTKADSSKWHYSPEMLARLMEYCRRDVEAETELHLALPELSPSEQQTWWLDQRINWRGIFVDRPLVKTVQAMTAVELYRLNVELNRLTNGEIETTGQRDAILRWLASRGLHLGDLRANTVEETLKRADLVGPCREVLDIRAQAAKTSTAKYAALESRSRSDSRIHFTQVYHAAAHGRFGGAGVQTQNLPRGNVKDTVAACEDLRGGDTEWIRTIYGRPLDVFSSCIRSMLRAPEGKTFVCGDFSSIEARVLFWMADYRAGCEAFARGAKMYEEMAGVIFRRPPESILKGSIERFVGKETFLGAGYGLGFARFMDQCAQKGHPISGELARTAINSYRSKHKHVPVLWKKVEHAFISAIQIRGAVLSAGRCKWVYPVDSKFLYCYLPSGRRIAFYKPEIRHKEAPWGERLPKAYHWAVDSVTHQWALFPTWGGTLVEYIVSGTARDFLVESMKRVEAEGFPVVLTVHDEIVAERPAADPSFGRFIELMETVPAWAAGCPIKAEGWHGPVYHK